jgi:hypothetical protein
MGGCRPLHSTSFTTGTRPVGSIGPAWLPPADLVSGEANVERWCCRPPHSTSFTTGARPVGSIGPAWLPHADLVSVEVNVEGGVLPSASLNFLHHRRKTGGIDRASLAAARRPRVGGGKR